MRKYSKSFWIVIGIAALFFIVLMILSSVLQLGERLRTIHPYVEYAFYGVSGILFILLIVRPIVQVLFSPTFSMDSLFDEEQNAKENFHMYRRVAKNLLTEEYISEEEKQSIQEHLGDAIELKQVLSQIFDTTIKKELNKMIVIHAESVFLTTAISQNGKLDALAVLTINLRAIKELVMKCGFRPSYAALGRLSFNVMSSALIAESLEDMKFSEIFPQSSLNALAEMPILKTVTGSLAQGAGNALLSLRVGIICRNYLFMNLKGQSKKEIKKMAFAEAIVLFPRVIGESIKKIPKRFKDLFGNLFS
ncbi:MAG: DUF697 domain-containing protein [Bacilli bacterium]|nr:DUF697 domain-containing protein [Bacilli bacterium]MBN2877497.1 DUF697 domain-containing protein [Bacilli bacterium]